MSVRISQNNLHTAVMFYRRFKTLSSLVYIYILRLIIKRLFSMLDVVFYLNDSSKLAIENFTRSLDITMCLHLTCIFYHKKCGTFSFQKHKNAI